MTVAADIAPESDTTAGGVPRWLRSSEEGQTLVLTSVAMVVLLGFLGLAVDVGNAMLQKRRLQAAVDLGLLSGAEKLPDTTTAAADAVSYTNTNFHKVINAAVSTQTSTGCQVAGCASPDKISLTASTTIPTYFVKLFGVDQWNISASGAACGPCDSSTVKFDVIVILDRSYSMCLNDDGSYNGCSDLTNAVAGIKSLESFFSPSTDRLGLVELSSADSVTPLNHSGNAAPCDTANVNDLGVSGKGYFYNTLGDFMDGTAASHDSWLVAPLSSSFKNANGSLNTTGAFNSDLTCAKSKFWTPIAPAVQAATNELVNNGRPDAKKVIVYFGDGGADAQPMKRDANGNATTTPSWYTPTAGNNGQPCHDAVGQSTIAKNDGITLYTIGYDLNGGTAQTCRHNDFSVESGITAQTTLQQMASSSADFFQQADPGEVYQIFNAVGHSITSGGERLIQ